eukprot:scaffold349127_cov14-Prasinocladus_malaysianus.AAC.1
MHGDAVLYIVVISLKREETLNSQTRMEPREGGSTPSSWDENPSDFLDQMCVTRETAAKMPWLR